jgi:hypothetical protein
MLGVIVQPSVIKEVKRFDGIYKLIALYATYGLKIYELTILIEEFHSYARHIKCFT